MVDIFLIAALSLLAQFVFPWWSIAIVAFALCLWRSINAGRAFLYGFAGIAIVWFFYALLIHLRTDGIFTSRMGQLLFKTTGSTTPMAVTALLGGLVGGLAGLSGFYVRQLIGNQITNRAGK